MFGSVLFLLSGLLILLQPKKAEATITSYSPDPANSIPADQKAILDNCDNVRPLQSPGYVRWISIAGRPLERSIVLTPGLSSINLELHIAAVVCSNRSAVNLTTFQIAPNVSPGAESILGRGLALNFNSVPGGTGVKGTYRRTSATFTYSPPGGFNRIGQYNISLDNRSINAFTSGSFYCVGNGVKVANFLDFVPCTVSTPTFSIQVLPPPNVVPISTINPNCLSIAVSSSDGDFAGGPNWTLEADYNTPNYRQLASGRGNRVYNIQDEFYAKRDHNITLVTYDVNSAGNNIGGGVRSAPKTLTCEKFELSPTTSVNLIPDGESPDKATFGGGATRTAGTTGTIPVKGVNIFREYFYVKNGSPEKTLAPAPSVYANQTIGSPINFASDDRSLAGLNLVAGDCVRQSVTVDFNSGLLDVNYKRGAGIVNGEGKIEKRGLEKNLRTCVPIVNKPYVSFYGGDVNTCGAIDTFYNVGGFGSGVQYAAQAFGNIGQFSSARLTGIGTGPKVLSFANNDPGKQYGGAFGDGGCTAQRDYFTGKPAESLNPGSVNVSDLSDGKVSYKGNISLQGKIQSGRRTALYIEGDLNITGNIEYADPNWSTFANIPSLHVYVKGNIYVQPGVSTLTGFYVAQKDTTGAKGIIDTCANGFISYTNLSEIWNSCKSTLSIRGAFASKQTLFRRGNNSLRNANTPIEKDGYLSSNGAERFYIGPEMYLVGPDTTSTGGSGGSGGYQYETVLPPLL